MIGLLLDTHATLWWFTDPAAVSATATEAIASPDNQVWISAATIWELGIKFKLGKLPAAGALLGNPALLSDQGFRELPITWSHAKRAADLPLLHRDPFDRLIVAQAQLEGLAVVSVDAALRAYGMELLW